MLSNNSVIITRNPATEEEISHYKLFRERDLDSALEASLRAYKTWRKSSVTERQKLLDNIAKQLEENSEELSLLITDEMGKPIRESRAEVKKSAMLCRYFSENAESLLLGSNIELSQKTASVYLDSIGVVLGIMPWNFPLWQVMRFSVPSLLLGNACLLKPSETTVGVALYIERLMKNASAIDGLFQTLVVSLEQTKRVIEASCVRMVNFTGSVRGGRAVAAIAGQALKKTVLELGGSDPYIIFDNCDLELAAKSCVTGRMINGGQSCVAAKRWIVHSRVKHDFEILVSDLLSDYKCENPRLDQTKLGPMARSDLREALISQTSATIQSGARLLYGGQAYTGKGYFFHPTILTDVQPHWRAFREETFGPLAVITEFKNDNEAFELANASEFGLGAALFTRNVDWAIEKAQNHIESGMVFINDFVRSYPEVPFGGVKNSGYGRELGEVGLKELSNIKTIVSAE